MATVKYGLGQNPETSLDIAIVTLPVIKYLISIVPIVSAMCHETAFIILFVGLSALSLALKTRFKP